MAELVDRIPGRALAIYAHPDDADVSCGGTLAAWARGGCEVHLVVCTTGDKGTTSKGTDPGELVVRRAREVLEASKLLGLSSVRRLEIPDGKVENSASLRGELVGLVRLLRPEIVLCPDPTAVLFGEHYFNHRDHREAGWAALDALSPAASSPLYFPERGEPHQVGVVLLSGTLEPVVFVDITATIDLKADAIGCHASQLGEAGEWFRTVVRERAEEAGRQAGVRFAEGFRRLRLDG